jgi:hypothetical protein
MLSSGQIIQNNIFILLFMLLIRIVSVQNLKKNEIERIVYNNSCVDVVIKGHI